MTSIKDQLLAVPDSGTGKAGCTSQLHGLWDMNPYDLLALFKTQCECPSQAEMSGEFAAHTLKQLKVIDRIMNLLFCNNIVFTGRWVTKAFRPIDEKHGRGYNSFQRFGKVLRLYPNMTMIAPSRFDMKPSYQLIYHAFHSTFGDAHMIDEIRRLSPGVYLGFGALGMDTKPMPFLLTGPVAPYRQDIGKKRQGFDLEAELPLLADAKA